MKRMSLICFLSACALVAAGCSSSSGGAGTGATGGAGGAGNSAGGAGQGTGGAADRGAGGAQGGSAGSACPAPPPLSGNECRSATECPRGGREYYCTTNPAGVLSACPSNCVSPPPQHNCSVDTDCPTGNICVSLPTHCCGTKSTFCQMSCTTPGFTCPADTVCAPGSATAGANGCAPQLCDAGYTCPAGFECAAGVYWADAHGCQEKPCSQTGCPVNFVCQTTAITGGCTAKPCTSDGDCDACGFCVERTCADRLGACVMPLS